MKGNQHSREEDAAFFPPLIEFARKSAVLLLRFESLLLVGIFLYLCGAGITSGVAEPSVFASILLFSGSAAAGLFFCSRGFAQRKSYGRAPALLANLIALGVAYFMISGNLIWVGTGLGLLAGATAAASLLGYTE